MKDKYILDSSIWIELERKNQAIIGKVAPLFMKNLIITIDVISAEVLRGVKTKQDYIKLEKMLSNFVHLSTQWDEVAKLAFEVAKKGYYPPLIDLYIAQCVLDSKTTLITQDKHFAQITKVKSHLKLMML
ncbi:MAG: PIN domain-containing protein [Bacteriovoracaceae bacterium]|nr:PIN domain-containing protein [Bacteriovoracaceae bacterium]